MLDYCVHNKINHIYNELQIKVDVVLVATTNQCHAGEFTSQCCVGS